MRTNSNSARTAALRRRAEARLQLKTLDVAPLQDDLNVRRLYHELQVYQIELDMQREELQRTREALAMAEQKCAAFQDLIVKRYALPECNALTPAKSSADSCGHCLHGETIKQLQARVATLTAREQQVLRELVQGRCTKSVAQCLNISPRTVEIHRTRILKKLSFASFHELLASPITCFLAASMVPT